MPRAHSKPHNIAPDALEGLLPLLRAPNQAPLPAQACWTRLLLSPQRMVRGRPTNPTWRQAERSRRAPSGLFARTRRPASR